MKCGKIVAMLLCLCLLLCGCADVAQESETIKNTIANATIGDSFSNRDYEIGYDETECAYITLNGDSASCDSDAVSISNNTVTILDEGTYVLAGTLNGMVIVNADKTDKIQLVLNGAEIQSESSAAIYVLQADKVFLTLPDETQNTLSNGGEFIAIDDNTIDAVVFSKEDLTLNGLGSLTVQSPAGHGIVSKDDLVITGGVYTITAARHAISGKDSVGIADGDFTLTAGKDGIHAENTDDATLGTMLLTGGSYTINTEDDGISASGQLQIDGGSYQIACADDGIHTDAGLMVNDGRIEVIESYEGLEGLTISITGGDITVKASDDGLNAAGGNDGSGREKFAGNANAAITISGGTLHIDAEGDGIDSNGSLFVSGGETYVSGPTNGGNGALDYGTQAQITGGIFVAAGSSQMAMNFSEATQGSVLLTVGRQSAGTEITLTDSVGNLLLSFAPEKQYESVVFSCPSLAQGESYSISVGSFAQTLTIDTLLTGGGGMGTMPGRRFPDGIGGNPGRMPPGGTDNIPNETPPDGTGTFPDETPPDGTGMLPDETPPDETNTLPQL